MSSWSHVRGFTLPICFINADNLIFSICKLPWHNSQKSEITGVGAPLITECSETAMNEMAPNQHLKKNKILKQTLLWQVCPQTTAWTFSKTTETLPKKIEKYMFVARLCFSADK